MKFKTLAGTLSVIVMLSTPTLAQTHVTLDKPLLVLLIDQSEIVGLRAKALDADITGLTNDQISGDVITADVVKPTTLTVNSQSEESDVLQAQAKTLNIDTTGSTEDEIRIQLKTVGQVKQLATLKTKAKALDIDISGLTNDQARDKIKTSERANTLAHLLADAKTLGIRVDTMRSV